MDIVSILLIAVVLGCAVVLIYMSKKPIPPEPVPDPIPDPIPKPEPNKNTILEYKPVKSTRQCPYCDGENSSGSQVCIICGRDI